MAFLASCASEPAVTRVDASTQIDLSGNWNDSDITIISESLVSDCKNARAIAKFTQSNGRTPVIVVGAFKNRSDEHIDTSIVTKKFEIALTNSGNAQMVSSGSERQEARAERADQAVNASEDTAKALANETAADFILQGTIKTIVDAVDGKKVRSYFVSAQLVDVETTKIVWTGENSEIKKVITHAKTRL